MRHVAFVHVKNAPYSPEPYNSIGMPAKMIYLCGCKAIEPGLIGYCVAGGWDFDSIFIWITYLIMHIRDFLKGKCVQCLSKKRCVIIQFSNSGRIWMYVINNFPTSPDRIANFDYESGALRRAGESWEISYRRRCSMMRNRFVFKQFAVVALTILPRILNAQCLIIWLREDSLIWLRHRAWNMHNMLE